MLHLTGFTYQSLSVLLWLSPRILRFAQKISSGKWNLRHYVYIRDAECKLTEKSDISSHTLNKNF